jgi:peptidoglycan-associated lipoprotein
MPKRALFYGVAMFSVAIFMTAGCATHDVVKKDESIVPALNAKQINQSKSNVTPAKETVTSPAPQATPANVPTTNKPVQKGSANAQLQSALEKIYFEYDSASLTELARKSLTRNASLLMKEPTAQVRIEGNCDERGSAEYNVALGEQRARAALQYLKTLGIKPDRLFTLSYGKDKPAVEGHDEAAMAKNRRDEFVVLTR